MDAKSSGAADGSGGLGAHRRAAAVLFGSEMRERREDAGWSRRELAEAAGISERYVLMLEVGDKQPALETLLRVSRALGARPGELVDAVDAQWEEEP